uniref:Ubiquitin-like domain-containing protein n=1 Tax=Clytia hemisphaerica TaxID=252671 RepID=A0A7M5XCT7_9CNID
MQIFIKLIAGITKTFNVEPNDRIHTVKGWITDVIGAPIDQQRLIFCGKLLEDHKAIRDYKIYEDSTLHMVLRLRGMISNFSEFDEKDPLNAFLMQGDVTGVEISEQLLKEKRKTCDFGSKISKLKLHYTGDEILSDEQRRKLINLADFTHFLHQVKKKSETVFQDIKIIIPNGLLNQIIESVGVEDTLKSHHTETSCNTKFVLRRTSPTQGCLPWHVDGVYSNSVVQSTLNDDKSFTGGKLCYFIDDTGLFILVVLLELYLCIRKKSCCHKDC